MMNKFLLSIGTSLLMMGSPSIYSQNAPLFNISATGRPATVEIELCLDATCQFSCQKYTVNASNLLINTFTSGPNGGGYLNAGIKIITPGFIIQNITAVCTPIANGFCLFAVNSTPPKAITIKRPSPMIVAGNYVTPPSDPAQPALAPIFPLLAYSANDGLTWDYVIDSTPSTLPFDYVGYPPIAFLGFPPNIFNSTSCIGLTCIVAGQYSNDLPASPLLSTFPLLARSIDGGASWTYILDSTNVPARPTNYNDSGVFNTTSCDGINCVAAGNYKGPDLDAPPSPRVMFPLLAHSSDIGLTWAYVIDRDNPAIHPFQYASNGNFNSASCSGNICVAVGRYIAIINQQGHAFYAYPLLANSTDGGTTWAYRIDGTATPPGGPGFTTLLPADYYNLGVFNSATCTGLNCITAGQYSVSFTAAGPLYPFLAYSTDGGITWSYSIDSTHTPLPADYNNQGILKTTSCSGLNCITGGQYASAATTYPLLANSTDGGASWIYSIDSTHTPLPSDYASGGVLNSSSCSGLNCVAAGQYSNGTATFPLLANSTNGGITWVYSIDSMHTTLPSDYNTGGVFNSASCDDLLNCIAVGQYSNGSTFFPLLANSTDGGRTWSYRINSIMPTLPLDYFNAGVFNAGSIGMPALLLPESLAFLEEVADEERP